MDRIKLCSHVALDSGMTFGRDDWNEIPSPTDLSPGPTSVHTHLLVGVGPTGTWVQAMSFCGVDTACAADLRQKV